MAESPVVRKRTSEYVSRIASKYLHVVGVDLRKKVNSSTYVSAVSREAWEDLAHDIRTLAASALSQDEVKGDG